MAQKSSVWGSSTRCPAKFGKFWRRTTSLAAKQIEVYVEKLSCWTSVLVPVSSQSIKQWGKSSWIFACGRQCASARMDIHSNVFFGKWMFAPVQKDFTTVQNQIQILQGEELGDLTEQSDWTDGPWRSYSWLDQAIHKQLPSKAYIFSVSRWKISITSTIKRNLGTGENRIIRLIRVRVEDFPRTHHSSGPPRSPEDHGWWDKSFVPLQGSQHLLVDVHWHWLESKAQTWTSSRVSAYAKQSTTGCWTCLCSGDEENASPTSLMESGTTLSRQCWRNQFFRAEAFNQRFFEKQKVGGKNSFHFIACFGTAEILLKTIVFMTVEQKNGATAEYVFTDSVLCLVENAKLIHDRGKFLRVVEFDPFRELFDIAGESVVFVWRDLPRTHCRTALPRCPEEDGRRERDASVPFQGPRHLSCRFSTILTRAKDTIRLLQEKSITRVRLCQEFSDRVLDISRQ